MRSTARIAVLAAAALLLALAATGAGSAAPAATGTVAAIQLKPVGGSGVQGVAFLQQKGKKVTGWVVVWGLEPGSTHAMHIHGPNGSCTKGTGVAVGFPDLVADAQGVAFAKLSGDAKTQTLKKGFYLNVHVYSSEEIQTKGLDATTCGNMRAVA